MEAVIVEGEKPVVKPTGVVADKLTVPVYPVSAVSVMVDVPEEPDVTVMLVGLEEILKSGAGETSTVTVVEWTSVVPLVPVTVTV